MHKIACVVLASFGFFQGGSRIIESILSYISASFTIDLILLAMLGQYLGFVLAGVLGYKGNKLAPYIALFFLALWAYFHFGQLFYPLNQPGFFGKTGLASWQRYLNIAFVGVVYAVALASSVWVLFKHNKSLKQDK
jgi:hypothetical protein